MRGISGDDKPQLRKSQSQPPRRLLSSTLLLVAALAPALEAHGVSGKDAVFLQGLKGRAIIPLMYLGAKHMVTGYDHLLFLVGVIFFLYRLKDVVQLRQPVHDRAQRHAARRRARRHPRQLVPDRRHHRLLRRLQGVREHGRLPALLRLPAEHAGWPCSIFGFFHGFGLATKLQDFALSPNGLVANIVSFNVGVEIGQVPGADGDSDRVDVVADAQRILSSRLRLQRCRDGVRFPARRLSAVGLFPLGGVTWIQSASM